MVSYGRVFNILNIENNKGYWLLFIRLEKTFVEDILIIF